MNPSTSKCILYWLGPFVVRVGEEIAVGFAGVVGQVRAGVKNSVKKRFFSGRSAFETIDDSIGHGLGRDKLGEGFKFWKEGVADRVVKVER